MKRDASLIPLSQQHHNGLALCVLTERALAEDAGDESVRNQAQRILDRYELELINHFSLEERLLFPACPPVLSALVEELIADHRRFESLVERLRNEPSRTLIRDFLGLLRRHIRREERELFEPAQALIPREALDEIGREIDEKAVRVCL